MTVRAGHFLGPCDAWRCAKLGERAAAVAMPVPMIDDWAEASAAGREPICSASSGRMVQATIDAAFESAREKRHVTIA